MAMDQPGGLPHLEAVNVARPLVVKGLGDQPRLVVGLRQNVFGGVNTAGSTEI